MPAANPVRAPALTDADKVFGVVTLVVGETASHAPPLVVAAAGVYVMAPPVLDTAMFCAVGVEPPIV